VSTITPRTPCIDHPRLFVAPEGEHAKSPAGRLRVHNAKALCWTCPIQQACRDEGRRLGAEGIWGGEDDKQRKAAGTRIVPVPTIGLPPAACGTEAGAQRHRRNRETVCDRCLDASAEACRRRRNTRTAERPANMPRRGPQILALLADGMTPLDISHHLHLDKSTIYGTIQRICTHLGVPSDRIVEEAQAQGLVPAAAAPADLAAAA
jgi:DNA-binding CsgD family transcriptional regulator